MLIRCTYCQTELSVPEKPLSFKCAFKEPRRKKACGHTNYDVLRADIPLLFVIKDGGLLFQGIKDGVPVFDKSLRARFLIKKTRTKL
jgi:hypothetical protein